MKFLIKTKQKKQQRINFIIISVAISFAALAFVVTGFKENIVFFYSPSELLNNAINKKKVIQKVIRVGGLVKEGTVVSKNNDLEFIITDLQKEIKIKYSGIKPDLFREKQGTIAKGTWYEEKEVFLAEELLTKHDEKYMPPEVKKALKKPD